MDIGVSFHSQPYCFPGFLWTKAYSISNLFGTYNVTAPYPYQTFHPNDTMTINWTLTQSGLPRLAEMNIFLVSNNASTKTNYTVGLNTARGLQNVQYWDYSIPSTIVPGVYQLVFECRERQVNLLVTDDDMHIPIIVSKPGTQTAPAVSHAQILAKTSSAKLLVIFVMLLPFLSFKISQ